MSGLKYPGACGSNYHETLRGLKELFDPNNVSNPPTQRLLWNAVPEDMIK
jgi:hypothetical protein